MIQIAPTSSTDNTYNASTGYLITPVVGAALAGGIIGFLIGFVAGVYLVIRRFRGF